MKREKNTRDFKIVNSKCESINQEGVRCIYINFRDNF